VLPNAVPEADSDHIPNLLVKILVGFTIQFYYFLNPFVHGLKVLGLLSKPTHEDKLLYVSLGIDVVE